MCIYTRVFVCAIFLCTCVFIGVFMCAYLYVCLCVHACVFMCVHIWMCFCVCTCVCIGGVLWFEGQRQPAQGVNSKAEETCELLQWGSFHGWSRLERSQNPFLSQPFEPPPRWCLQHDQKEIDSLLSLLSTPSLFLLHLSLSLSYTASSAIVPSPAQVMTGFLCR